MQTLNGRGKLSRTRSRSGREILSVSRIAHGGPDYAGLQNVTVQASGFVNAAAFGGLAANPLGAMAEVKLRFSLRIRSSDCSRVGRVARRFLTRCVRMEVPTIQSVSEARL